MTDADQSRFGEQIAQRFALPVYLYGEAALRPERRRLAHVRRGQYEALREEIGVNPDRAPDFGPARLHPRGGAVAVGARRPLTAFNINLRTDDLALAIKIATAIRESSGGLPAVQAMGVLLENPGEPPMAGAGDRGDPVRRGVGDQAVHRGGGAAPGGRRQLPVQCRRVSEVLGPPIQGLGG